MPADMVLNELSFRETASDRWQAQRRMETLISTLAEAAALGLHRVLHLDPEIWHDLLADGYTLDQWLHDRSVQRELQQFFRGLQLKSPLLADRLDLQDKQATEEYVTEGLPAKGLGAAIQMGSFAVSLATAAKWDFGHVEVEHLWLDEEGSLHSGPVEVIHASRASHVREHQNWIDEQRKLSVRRGKDLWRRRHELFPDLLFCDAVEEQLNRITASDPLLRPITVRLLELDTYCRNWTSGSFDRTRLPTKTSRESHATLEQYGEVRTFFCPDKQYHTFSWHVRLTPHAWRVHFYPDPKTCTITIGYIGPHLPTVSDPT